MAAGEACVPVPMQVVQHENPLDDNSPVVRAYEPIMDGSCGFAWIRFPGNSSWAKWCAKKNLSGDAYPTGKQIWVSQFNQSIARKEAYAYAFANVLTSHGIERVYAGSRDD
jgi:hypothetical protein